MIEATRHFVTSHMHSTGAARHLLSDREWGFVYLNGDGFGTISETFARRNCWDWSHVRDSSPEGMTRMAEAILAILNRRRRPGTVMNSRAYARNVLGKNV